MNFQLKHPHKSPVSDVEKKRSGQKLQKFMHLYLSVTETFTNIYADRESWVHWLYIDYEYAGCAGWLAGWPAGNEIKVNHAARTKTNELLIDAQTAAT